MIKKNSIRFYLGSLTFISLLFISYKFTQFFKSQKVEVNYWQSLNANTDNSNPAKTGFDYQASAKCGRR